MNVINYHKKLDAPDYTKNTFLILLRKSFNNAISEGGISVSKINYSDIKYFRLFTDVESENLIKT